MEYFFSPVKMFIVYNENACLFVCLFTGSAFVFDKIQTWNIIILASF